MCRTYANTVDYATAKCNLVTDIIIDGKQINVQSPHNTEGSRPTN